VIELEKLLRSAVCETATAYSGVFGLVPEVVLGILPEQTELHLVQEHTLSELLGCRVRRCLYSFV